MTSTACLLCAYEEEDTIARACETLVQQTHAFDEFYLVDSGSEDNTADIALSYVDDVIQAPKGKLSARNFALNPPVDASWDGPDSEIIFNTDADKRYPAEWADTIFRNFFRENVVAVTGETRYMENGEKNLESHIADVVEVNLRGLTKYMFSDGITLEGGNSAFLKSAFIKAGGFDTSWVDETEIWQVFHEEEFYFPHRLSQFGEIVLEREAVAYEPPRRLVAAFADTEFSQQVGTGRM